MKIKTILIGSIIMLIVFLIYLTTLDKKVYYLSLGDSLASGTTPYGSRDYGYGDYLKDYLKEKNILEKYIMEFNEVDYRTTDLLRDIKDNKKININNKKQTIKNALIKADLITLSIGYNDLLYKISINNTDKSELLNHVDGVMEDIDELLNYIKEYCKEDIVVLGYYVPILHGNNQLINEYIKYANEKLKILANRYNMKYIDISFIVNNKEIFDNPVSPFPSKQGYELIANEIIKCVNNILF